MKKHNGKWEYIKTSAGKPWLWRCNCGQPNVNWAFFCSKCHSEIPIGTEPSSPFTINEAAQ